MKRKMKKSHIAIFCLTLSGSLFIINSASAKTYLDNIHVAEISDGYSSLISLNSRNLILSVVLNKTGDLQWIRLNTQGVILIISPEGRLLRKSPNDKKIQIQYTDTSAQHIRQVGDINILYANTSYQRIRQVGDIQIQYTDTSYQHIRQVGSIVIQYRDTSYKEILQAVGNQPGVTVRIEN